MKRRTEITIETERVGVLGCGVVREDAARWCEECGAESRLVAPDTAALLLGIGTEAIPRWAESAGLHFVAGADSASLLCLGSLPRGGAHNTRAVELTTDDGESIQPEF